MKTATLRPTRKRTMIRRAAPRELAAFRPSLLTEVVFVPLGDRIVVDGAHRPQLLQGRSVRTLVPELSRYMDGSRTLEEIERILSLFPPEHIRAAVSLLFNAGLVEDGTSDHETNPIPNLETLRFFRRFRAVTGMNRSGLQAYEKLQTAEVVVVGRADDGQSCALKSALEKTGVGRVPLLDRSSLSSWQPGAGVTRSQSLIVSLSFGCEDRGWHATLDEWCFKHEIPWLRSVVDKREGYADIGPLFNTRDNACYDCFQRMHLDSRTNTLSVPRQTLAQFWTNMIATEVIYLLTRVGPLLTGRDFRRYHLQDWSSQPLRFARMPGCSRCLPINGRTETDGRTSSNGRVDSSVLFEDMVGARSRAFLSTLEGNGHPGMISTLTSESKQLLNCPSIPLSDQIPKLDRGVLDVLRKRTPTQWPTFSVAELGALLRMTAGFRESNEQARRWAATGGNLGSVELYVAVRAVDGLAPGFYFYQPRDHSLARFQRRQDSVKVNDFMQSVIGCSDHLPDVLVLFTGAFHRLSKKYGAFAYRLVNFDAGAAVSQLCMLATGLGICSRVVVRWADDLIEDQLNLSQFYEQTTAVVALSRQGANPGDSSSPKQVRRSDLPPSLKIAAEYRGLQLSDITRIVYMESRIKKDDLNIGSWQIPPALREVDAVGDVSVKFPPPTMGGLLLGDVMARRRSVRRFTAEPIRASQFGTMLAYAHQQDAHDWPEEHREHLPLKFVLLAWNTADFEPGVYSYDPSQNGLQLEGKAPAPAEKVELFVQDEFGGAPALVWIVGNLAAACARHGGFGHRQLLLRAGSAAHCLWMAGMGLGLAGCLLGGVVAGEGRRQFGFDGYKQASLLGIAIGYAAQGPK